MKRKLSILAFAVIAVAMLATPVLAIGPENALDKNQKIGNLNANDTYMENSNGIIIEWIQVVPINPELSATMLNKDAGNFKINNAFVVSSPAQVLQIENRWLYLSHDMLYNFYVFVGMPPFIAAGIADDHPDGIYLKRNLL